MKTKKIICLYGGPGTGKSTTCAGLFYKLKLAGYECEMNREYVKDWAWSGRQITEGDQSYFFAKMAMKERTYIKANLDFIITDSPLILTHFYGMKNDPFEQTYNTSLKMLANHHGFCKEKGYKVDHFFLERTKPYSDAGRYEDEDLSRQYDKEIKELLNEMNINFTSINCDKNCVDNIMSVLYKL